MNVLQLKRLASSAASLRARGRTDSGTRFFSAQAASAFTTTWSWRSSCPPARTPMARRPWNRIASTGRPQRISAPRSAAASAMARMSALQPPIGCQMPYSYSMNGRIEKSSGHSNGLIPRYLLWKLIARRTPSWRK